MGEIKENSSAKTDKNGRKRGRAHEQKLLKQQENAKNNCPASVVG